MPQHQDPVVIVSAARTPMGAFQGDFSDLAAHDLGGAAIKAAVARAGIAPEQVEEVLFGNCLMAGQGQAPARQAGFKGGLPQSTGAVTLSKMCGAGMEATILAHDQLIAGSRDVMIAGGMESMTNAPYLLKKGRARLPHGPRQGLRPHDAGRPGRRLRSRPLHGHLWRRLRRQVPVHARAARRVCHCQRAARAGKPPQSGAFDAEITPVTVKTRKGDVTISVDEGPAKAKLDKIASLKPAFKKDGTITAASSSSINDGAAAMVLMRAIHRPSSWAASRWPRSSAMPRTPRPPSGSPPPPWAPPKRR